MSGERQGNNPSEFVVLELPNLDKNETSAKTIEMEVYEGPGRVTLLGRIMESKPVKKAISWVAATVTAVSLVPGSMAAETESTVVPDKEIKIKGKMQSQELLEGQVAGGGGESPQYITLKPGDKGPDVERLKQGFFDLGYFEHESSVNDTYTTSTAEYVKKFEEINGLPVDGIADPEMQAVFFSDKARKADGSLVVPESYQSKEILPGSEEEKIINARFKSFLEGEGEFSDEKLKDKMYYSYPIVGSDLGFCGTTVDDKQFVVQGVLLGHFESGDKNFVAMGVKDEEVERKIALLQWLLDEDLKTYSRMTILSIDKKEYSEDYKANNYKTESELLSFLDIELLGKVVLFDLFNRSSINRSDLRKEIVDYFNKYVIPKYESNVSFVSGLLNQSNSIDFGLKGTVFSNPPEANQDVWVTNYSDVKNQMVDNFDNSPLMSIIEYSIGK